MSRRPPLAGLRVIECSLLGPGAVTTRLQQAYADAVHGRHPRSDEWLDYVNAETLTRQKA